ncbi:MAG: tetratricopeptide repeat protein, partial [Phycisphaerales bacterium]
EKAYRQAVQFMVQKHNAYLNLGNMYYKNLHQVDDAITAYRAAVEHMKAFRSKMFSSKPYLALGIALRAKGEYDEARRALEVARRYSKTRERAEAELARLPKRD